MALKKHFKIEMVVVATSGVEGGLAGGAARLAVEVLGDCEFGAAGSAEDGRPVPLGLRPDFDGMAGKSNVAVLAGVVETATFHLDGDDIRGAVVVEAAALWIEVEAANFWRFLRHALPLERITHIQDLCRAYGVRESLCSMLLSPGSPR